MPRSWSTLCGSCSARPTSERELRHPQLVKGVGRSVRTLEPQLLGGKAAFQHLGDDPSQRQRVRHAAGCQVLERLVGSRQRAGDEVPRVFFLARVLARPPEAEATLELEATDAGRVQRLGQPVARLHGGGRPRQAGDQRADRGAVLREVKGDPPGVVPLQLGAQLGNARRLVAGANADVVHVDLVLDRHQVHRAQQIVKLHQGRLQVGDGLVEGAVVGRVQVRHAQQAGQQVRQALSQLAHEVGEGAILADARAPQRARERVLGVADLVEQARRAIIHGDLRGSAGERPGRLRPPGAARHRRGRPAAR